MNKMLLCAAVLGAMSAPAYAQSTDVQRALSAAAAGEYDAAIPVLTKAAKAGDVVAQRELGLIYYEGTGVAQSNETAASWYQQAVDQGDALAMVRLGNLYVYSEGVDEDLGLAFDLIQQAAAQGLPEAITDLGWMYDYGYGVRRDVYAAFGLYVVAAHKGDHFAANNIAYMMIDREEGLEGFRDPIVGAGWCSLSEIWAPARDKEDIVNNCDDLRAQLNRQEVEQGKAWAKAYLANRQ